MPKRTPEISIDDFLRSAQSQLVTTRGTVVLKRDSLTVDAAQPVAGQQVRKDGTPTEQDMTLISKFLQSPVAPEGLFAFDCVPSNQRVDSYFTRMDISSLQNYASAAASGTPFMNSHKSGGSRGISLPLGLSFNGWVEDDPTLPGSQRSFASVYMLRNNRSTELNTDDVIAGIQAGINRDISIGFGYQQGTPEQNYQDRTWYECSICGQDWLRADPWSDDPDVCRHWPGEIYAFDGGQTKAICHMNVHNAILDEFSAVYAGATDGAVILKAQRAKEAGTLSRALTHNLESAYRTRLTGDYYSISPVSGLALPKGRELMAAKPKQAAVPGAGRDAIAGLIRTLVATRDLTSDELALIQDASNYLADGDIDNCNATLAKLMAGDDGDGDTDTEETDQENDAPDPEIGELIDMPAAEMAEADDEDTEADGRANDDTDDDGDTEEDDDKDGRSRAKTRTRRTDTALVMLQLTVSERQELSALRAEVRTLRTQVEDMTPLAEIGERYRTKLVAETVRQAVRAQLEEMGEADVFRMCQRLAIEDIERLYSQYKRQADATLGQKDADGTPLLQGGRQTVPLDPNATFLDQKRAATPNARRNDLNAYK
jgi:hypothetical protein